MNYSDLVLRLLKHAQAEEGDLLEVKAAGRDYKGILMPHHEFSHPDVIVIKLRSGYNAGVWLDDGSVIKVVSKRDTKHRAPKARTEVHGLKNVAVIGTGGTIASYVDYRTGAVHPALSAEDLMGAVPEITSICNIRAQVLFSIFSENMDPDAWAVIARAVKKAIDDGADGIIIPHGTDTMGYTAAALSFMLSGIDRPVVLVGAQRSSDRPSSDAYTNLIAAARFCVEADAAGVFVLMHDTISDTTAAVHKGTRVRKMHTSRRDAFQSINDRPVAKIDFEGKIEMLSQVGPRGKSILKLCDKMESSVLLLQFYPGMDPAATLALIKQYKGVVIAGSGLGHVSSKMIPALAEAISQGVVVIMTSQCLHGRVNLNVYATGRDLINAGVIQAEDMLPETALVKLMWALGQSIDGAEVRRLMSTNLCGEMSERREIDD